MHHMSHHVAPRCDTRQVATSRGKLRHAASCNMLQAEAEDPYEPALPSKQLSVAVASKPSTDDAPEGR